MAKSTRRAQCKIVARDATARPDATLVCINLKHVALFLIPELGKIEYGISSEVPIDGWTSLSDHLIEVFKAEFSEIYFDIRLGNEPYTIELEVKATLAGAVSRSLLRTFSGYIETQLIDRRDIAFDNLPVLTPH